MPTTAWRFPGTEGADQAVVRLQQLDSQDLINVMDVAVLRWPDYATEPTTQEHVTEHGGRVSALVRRFQHPVIAPQVQHLRALGYEESRDGQILVAQRVAVAGEETTVLEEIGALA